MADSNDLRAKGLPIIPVGGEKNNASLEDANVRLNFVQKLPYFMNTFGVTTWPIFMAFLSMFWTDVALIGPGVAALWLLISKLWDAVNDPIIGFLADRTQTKMGRYRPWIFSFIPASVLSVCVFTVLPGQAGTTGQAAFSLISYFLFVFVATMGEVTGMGLIAATTTDPTSRASIASFRMSGAYGANIVSGAIFMPMVMYFAMKEMVEVPEVGMVPNMAKGYFLSILIMTAIGIPFSIYYLLGTKERVTIPASKHSFKDNLFVLKGNKPFWIFFWAFLLYGVTSGLTTGRAYYWQYLVGSPTGIAVNITFWMCGMAAGAIIAGIVNQKVRNKATTAVIFYIFGGIICLVLWFMKLTPESSEGAVLAFNVVSIIQGVGVGAGTAAMYAIMPDITEYTQWKYGIRISGFVSSILNMSYQVSLAIGTASFTFMLSVLGYEPNVAQPENIQIGINLWCYFLPALFYVAPGLVMLKYKLDKKTFSDILAETAKRKDETDEEVEAAAAAIEE
jgi:Na+/melibiose symporter-like transporter